MMHEYVLRKLKLPFWAAYVDNKELLILLKPENTNIKGVYNSITSYFIIQSPHKLKYIRNSADLLLTHTPSWDHITPVLQNRLHLHTPLC